MFSILKSEFENFFNIFTTTALIKTLQYSTVFCCLYFLNSYNNAKIFSFLFQSFTTQIRSHLLRTLALTKCQMPVARMTTTISSLRALNSLPTVMAVVRQFTLEIWAGVHVEEKWRNRAVLVVPLAQLAGCADPMAVGRDRHLISVGASLSGYPVFRGELRMVKCCFRSARSWPR